MITSKPKGYHHQGGPLPKMLDNCDYPYPCEDCDKAFKRNDHLKRHFEAVHSQIKYMCNICGKKMSRKDHLKRHIGNVHPSMTYHNNNETCVNGEVGGVQNEPKAKVKKFPCEYCLKLFTRKDHVLRHVRSLHPEVHANQLPTLVTH